MKGNKLLAVLASLDSAEIKEFGRYLEGTTYRKGAATIALFNYLKKYHPEFPEDKVLKELVHRKIRKDKKPVGRDFIDLVSRLYGKLEDFLVEKKLKEHSFLKDYLALEVLRERRLDNLFFNKASLMEKNWDDISEPGIESLHDEYLLQHAIFFHPNYISYKKQHPNKRATPFTLLDNYFGAAKMYQAVCLTSNQIWNDGDEKIEDDELSNELLKKLVLHLEGDETRPIQVRVLHATLKSYLNESFAKDYKPARDLIFANFSAFSKDQKIDLYTYLMKCCLVNIKKGDSAGWSELLAIYKKRDESDLLVIDERIESHDFRSIVRVACALNDFDWADYFISKYSECLPEEKDQASIVLSKAQVHFARGEFDKVVDLLNSLHFASALFGIEARFLLIQCHYELEEIELFLNLHRSFTAFLARVKDIQPVVLEQMKEFLHWSKRIMTIKLEPNRTGKELKEEWKQVGMIPGKIWLNQKIEQL